MVESLETIIKERDSNYGNYKTQSEISQFLKNYFKDNLTTETIEKNPDMVESLDCIAMKLSRILNGNPYHADSWKDIAGYAKLISDRLETKNTETLILGHPKYSGTAKVIG